MNNKNQLTNNITTRTLQPNLIPRIITRQEHTISRKQISSNALKVLYKLHDAGFGAFLVGGCIRDLLLKLHPKDFDIVTNATPEQIKSIFKNCRLIGRRFRLAHIIFGRDIIEVATFRGHHNDADESNKNFVKHSQKGMLLRDNVYGSIEQDAQRRDFSINALYYNIANCAIYDYSNGISDLKEGLISLIGDPITRYREDPVRMLRAIRFAVKLDFDIEEATAEHIERLAPLLKEVPAARLFEEVLKLLQSSKGLETYYLLREYNLFEQLFPCVASFFTADYSSKTEKMLDVIFDSTDLRLEQGKKVNPAFMFAAMLWYPLTKLIENLIKKRKISYHDAMMLASNTILDDQVTTIAIPRYHSTTIKEIWQLQLRLSKRTGKHAFRLLELEKFRAGFDLLIMRSTIEGKQTKQLANWWETFQVAKREQRQNMIANLEVND